MKSVRIHAINHLMISIDIVCVCGRNAPKNKETGVTSTKHAFAINARYAKPPVLVCQCGKEFEIMSQRDHIHINEL